MGINIDIKWKKLVMNRYFFFKLLISTLTISIMPLLISSILSYYSSKEAIENQLYISNINYVKQTVNAVEIIMKQIDINCTQLLFDNTLKNFINYPEGLYYERIVGEFKNEDLPNLFKYIDNKRLIFERLKLFQQVNEFINSVYVYDCKKNIILVSNGIQYTLNEFYDKSLFSIIEKNNRWPYFSEIRLIKKDYNNSQKVISIIYKLFDSDNIFIINLDVEYLNKRIIEKLDTKTKNFISVFSDTGNIILSNEKIIDNYLIKNLINFENKIKDSDSYIKEIGRKKFMVNYIKTNIANWLFVGIIDLDDLYAGINNIIKVIIMTAVILLILTVLLAFISSKNIYKPIYSIIQLIKKRSENCTSEINNNSKDMSTGEISFISGSLVNAYKEKELLQNKLIETLPVFKERFLYSLTRSNFYDSLSYNDIIEKIDFLGVKISIKKLLLLILEIERFQISETDVEKNCFEKLRIIEILRKKISLRYNMEISEVQEDKFMIIINCEKDEIENTLSYAHELIEELKNDMNIMVTIGVGQYCYDILDLPKSYLDAEEALKHKIVVGCNEVIYINDIKLNNIQQFHYPKQIEIKLNDYIRNGDKESAISAFEQIIKNIRTQDEYLHYSQAQRVFIQLLTSVISTVYTLGIDFESILQEDTNAYYILLQKENIDDISDYFKNIITKTSLYISDAYKEKNNRHIEDIVKILNVDCGNSTSLNIIAEQLHMNPSYISRLFKEKTGKSFTEYLTNIRLEKAKTILLETDLKVEEIGKSLGYNKSYYFIKLFKEHTGSTPGDFRKIYSYRTQNINKCL